MSTLLPTLVIVAFVGLFAGKGLPFDYRFGAKAVEVVVLWRWVGRRIPYRDVVSVEILQRRHVLDSRRYSALTVALPNRSWSRYVLIAMANGRRYLLTPGNAEDFVADLNKRLPRR